MKKFIYAIRLIGIFGILSLWVANAKQETIYITWTDWTIIQTNNQEWEDLELYLRSNANYDNINLHYTIMDRNLWAITNDVTSTWSYWYYYQWWNNYWFSYPLSGTSFSSEKVDVSEFWPWNYYASNVFHTWDFYNTYLLNDNQNLWWWESSVISDKQWPCPSGYHIPSEGEISPELKFTKNNHWDSYYFPSFNAKIPEASMIREYGVKDNYDYGAFYRLSNYFTEMSYRVFYWEGSYSFDIRSRNNNTASPIRCYKNVPNDQNISINLNGGIWKVSISVLWNQIISLNWTPYKSNAVFNWRYWNENFEWDQVSTWDDVSGLSGIYAKFTCNTGYKENSSHYCEAINYYIDYELNWGSINWTNPYQYNIDTSTFTLKNPTKTWY